ncbi:MAG: malto-oligosyltrehalose synthase, partial [Verrucomicrobia bacterium]|nr:malto-oligosyltrehalose synthase [Verrucomicrobiota bacterium]
GLIADFVPNHMGIGQPTNTWWQDVLENGPSSLYAKCFDIDWQPLKGELENRVLLPILGDQYGRVLEKGELRLSFEGGAFFLRYFEHKLPINPRTYVAVLATALEILGHPKRETEAALSTSLAPEDLQISEIQSIITALEHMPTRMETNPKSIAERAREKQIVKRRLERLCEEDPTIADAIAQAVERFQGKPGDPSSFDALDQLIAAQAYRLSYWRVAAEEINYRRFFDINTLAAIRMEEPEVFETTHQLLFRLIERGAITGLRIDHPDGLYDPRGYFRQLQESVARLSGRALPEDGRGIYLLAEKILVGDEPLRVDWPVHGTTGYDFTVQVTALLVDPATERVFSKIYKEFIDRNVNYPFLVYEKKRQIMRLSLASDVNTLGSMLDRLSERNRLFRDYTLNALTTAVREVIACFPVYRTYLTPEQPEPSVDDQLAVGRAVAVAKRRNAATEASIFDFLRDILLFRFPPNTTAEALREHEAFVMKFQQCTGPIMAKGLEDTAFYIYNRLVALNEVGGEPDHFGATLDRFHKVTQKRAEHWPHAMLTSSTHDTKRSEDVRARIAALSELPTTWRSALSRWSKLNAPYKTQVDGEAAPDANEEYLLYQILLGSWPFEAEKMSDDEWQIYVRRIQDYMAKAVKEAKSNSSWIQPNPAWDQATGDFVAKLLARGRKNAFLRAFTPLAARVAELGAINSLSQTILKLTVPGVPDTYQGNELWDFSLVDPDNRRPVDYTLRTRLLAEVAGDEVDPRELLTNWHDGRIKLFVTHRLLRCRRDEAPELFRSGSYLPMEATGQHAENVVAFRRRHAGRELLVALPRLTANLGTPPIGERWGDTALALPREVANDDTRWRHLFTGAKLDLFAHGKSLPLATTLFADFPFAVLVR